MDEKIQKNDSVLLTQWKQNVVNQLREDYGWQIAYRVARTATTYEDQSQVLRTLMASTMQMFSRPEHKDHAGWLERLVQYPHWHPILLDIVADTPIELVEQLLIARSQWERHQIQQSFYWKWIARVFAQNPAVNEHDTQFQ